jgi:hypothetical protein
MAVSLAVLSASTTFRMLWIERPSGRGSPRSGMNRYLADNSFDSVQHFLEPVRSMSIYVVYPAVTHFNDALANGWFLLFAGKNGGDVTNEFGSVGEHLLPVSDTRSVLFDQQQPALNPPPARLLATLPETYVVQLGAMFVRPSTDLFEELQQQGRMRLLRPKTADWLFANFVWQRDSGDFLSLDRGVTVKSGPENYLRVHFQSTVDRPQGLTLRVTVDRGEADFHVYSDAQFGTVVPFDKGTTNVPTGPLRRGTTQIFLGPVTRGENPAQPVTATALHIARLEYAIRSSS